MRSVMADVYDGIFYLSRKYSRGYNLKFAADAEVILLANGTKMASNEAIQILGRGGRSQGSSTG
jgi:hypothetical protein